MLHTQEVTGSSPVPPISSPVLSEQLELRELLELILGPEGRRRLALRHMPNDKLFENYDKELMLRSRNPRNLESTRSLLAQFKQYLGEHLPSALLARGFLAKFTDKAPRTLLKYASIIKSFMRYCGEPIDDFPLPKVPRSLPNYYEDNEVERLLSAIENKKSHKGTIDRDSLLLI